MSVRAVLTDTELKRRFYPESNIGGFTHDDGTIGFFNHLVAIARPTDTVLDFGAGRGEPLLDDDVAYRRGIANFKGRSRHLDGCDVDPVVLHNPFLDQATVIDPGEPLPYEDGRFDIIVARSVFEHIENPGFVAGELLRVLAPGGVIAATTPNKWGYIGIAGRIVPSRHHVTVLAHSQPDRKPEDVFPTYYRMNTVAALRRAFGKRADVYVARKAPEPAYHFGRPWIYRLVKSMNKHAPDALLPIIHVYVRKH